MSKLKVIGTVLCFAGIAVLTVAGVTTSEIAAMVPIGVGIGAAVGGIVAIFKKE